MKKFGFVVVGALAVSIAGCGGGSSSPTPTAIATSTPTAAPATPVPTPIPTPGTVTLAYSSTFGASSASTAAPAPLAFQAPTQTATLTASEANYAGTYTAVSSCAQVTAVAGTAGTFTLTAADATVAAPVCTVTVTGATAQTASVAVSVPKPAGVQLRWYAPNFAGSANPVPITSSPINIVGSGATFGAVLAISEPNYVTGFPVAKVTNAGCTGVTLAAAATIPAGLPAAAPGASLVYYNVTGTAATAGSCVVTAQDLYVPLSGPANAAATIAVNVTAVTGAFQ